MVMVTGCGSPTASPATSLSASPPEAGIEFDHHVGRPVQADTFSCLRLTFCATALNLQVHLTSLAIEYGLWGVQVSSEDKMP